MKYEIPEDLLSKLYEHGKKDWESKEQMAEWYNRDINEFLDTMETSIGRFNSFLSEEQSKGVGVSFANVMRSLEYAIALNSDVDCLVKTDIDKLLISHLDVTARSFMSNKKYYPKGHALFNVNKLLEFYKGQVDEYFKKASEDKHLGESPENYLFRGFTE